MLRPSRNFVQLNNVIWPQPLILYNYLNCYSNFSNLGVDIFGTKYSFVDLENTINQLPKDYKWLSFKMDYEDVVKLHGDRHLMTVARNGWTKMISHIDSFASIEIGNAPSELLQLLFGLNVEQRTKIEKVYFFEYYGHLIKWNQSSICALFPILRQIISIRCPYLKLNYDGCKNQIGYIGIAPGCNGIWYTS